MHTVRYLVTKNYIPPSAASDGAEMSAGRHLRFKFKLHSHVDDKCCAFSCVQNVTSAYTLEVTSNAALTSFQGSFSSLEVDGDTVAIKSNTNLRSLAGLEVERLVNVFSLPNCC